MITRERLHLGLLTLSDDLPISILFVIRELPPHGGGFAHSLGEGFAFGFGLHLAEEPRCLDFDSEVGRTATFATFELPNPGAEVVESLQNLGAHVFGGAIFPFEAGNIPPRAADEALADGEELHSFGNFSGVQAKGFNPRAEGCLDFPAIEDGKGHLLLGGGGLGFGHFGRLHFWGERGNAPRGRKASAFEGEAKGANGVDRGEDGRAERVRGSRIMMGLRSVVVAGALCMGAIVGFCWGPSIGKGAMLQKSFESSRQWMARASRVEARLGPMSPVEVRPPR